MTQPAPPSLGERILDSAVAVLTQRTYGGSAVPLVVQHAATITRAYSAPSRKKLA